MTNIVTALFCEAKPLIEHFSLKRCGLSQRLEIFRNDRICVAVSGTGMVRSAAAAAYLAAYGSGFVKGGTSCLINMGICGAASEEIPLGMPLLANKVVNVSTGRAFYPDILFDAQLAEGCLYSLAAPVCKGSVSDGKGLYDMEAAGFMEASLLFLPPHKVQCLKVVSDHLDVKRLDPKAVSVLVKGCIPVLEALVSELASLDSAAAPILSDEDKSLLASISNGLKLSAAMRHELKNLAEEYVVRTGKCLEEKLIPFTKLSAGSKKDGKIPFDSLRRFLSGD